MKLVRATLLLAAMAFGASAADINGTWKAVFTGPLGEQPKTASEIVFELKAVGDKLTGTAHIGNWPGDGNLIDGRIEGDRFSFSVIGNSPWWSKGPNGEAGGLPKLSFTGTIQGTEMQLTVDWDSVMLYGAPPGHRSFEMKGSKMTAGR
jgi:hypothetical protein